MAFGEVVSADFAALAAEAEPDFGGGVLSVVAFSEARGEAASTGFGEEARRGNFLTG